MQPESLCLLGNIYRSSGHWCVRCVVTYNTHVKNVMLAPLIVCLSCIRVTHKPILIYTHIRTFLSLYFSSQTHTHTHTYIHTRTHTYIHPFTSAHSPLAMAHKSVKQESLNHSRTGRYKTLNSFGIPPLSKVQTNI